MNCKGKYILEIDQDDRFINDNAFDILYNVSEQYESDILNFKWAHGEDVLNLSKIENYINNKNILYETKNKLKPNIINYIKFLKHEFKVIKKLYPSLFKYFFEKIFTNTQLLNLDKKYLIKQFNIQKYLFSHLYLTSDEINNITNSISNSQTNIYNEKYLSELLIVIVFSNFEKISKLIKSIK